jgi:predicted esterase
MAGPALICPRLFGAALAVAAVGLCGNSCLGGDVVLRRAATHPIRYYLSLPQGQPQSVLVCVAGADADFAGLVEKYRRARGNRPFLIVAPCTFSNTNRLRGQTLARYRRLYSEEEIRRAGGQGLIPDVNRRLDWDEEGLLAFLEDLRTTLGTAPRIYLTGFSGGGLLVWRMIVRHPDQLALAVPVCPNFNCWGHGYCHWPPSRSAAALPVHVILGEKDSLRWYRYGGEFLPRPGRAVVLIGGLGALLGFLACRRRKRRHVAAIAVLGLVLISAVEVGRWTGNEAQTDAAVRLLRDLGYTNVRRSTEPGVWHEPAPGHVVRVIDEALPSDR